MQQLLDRDLKTGIHDLDRFARQVGDLLNSLLRSGIISRYDKPRLFDTGTPGRPAVSGDAAGLTTVPAGTSWTMPVVAEVETLTVTVTTAVETVTVLRATAADLTERVKTVEVVVKKFLVDYSRKFGPPPDLIPELAEALAEA